MAGEQVDTEVAVLASLGGDGDTDHLAGATLKDQDVTNADEVAGDRDRLWVGAAAGLDNAHILPDSITITGWATLVGDVDVITLIFIVVVRVDNALGNAFHTAAERVVVAFVVVVTHVASWGFVLNSRLGGGSFDCRRRVVFIPSGVGGLSVSVDGLGLVGVSVLCWLEAAGVGDVESAVLVVVVRVYTGLIAGVVRDVDVVGGTGSTTILFLSDVELVGQSLVVDRSVLTNNSSRLAVAITSEIYLWVRPVSSVTVVGLTVLCSRLIANINFLLSVDTSVRERSRDSSIFPFDARSAVKFAFSLYSRA